MADLIAASSLSGVSELISECGGDPVQMLTRLRIDPAVVGAHDRFVPFTTLSTLLGVCAGEFDVPDFALRLAARQDPDILGPLAIAARSAETFGEALGKVAEFAHVYSPAIAATLVADGPVVRYEFSSVLQRIPYRPHVVELAIGVTLSTIRMVSDGPFHPTRIEFTHPPIAPEPVYREHFGCPVDFEAPRNSVHVRAGLLDQRMRHVDRLVHDFTVQFLATRHRDTAFGDVVSTLVVRSLPTGTADLETVARLLIMHPRAVQRALAESGTTFKEVVDDARRELALTLLAGRNVPMSTVARQLGYAEQSVLTRSCRRWFGMTPLAKRRELTGLAAAD